MKNPIAIILALITDALRALPAKVRLGLLLGGVAVLAVLVVLSLTGVDLTALEEILLLLGLPEGSGIVTLLLGAIYLLVQSAVNITVNDVPETEPEQSVHDHEGESDDHNSALDAEHPALFT